MRATKAERRVEDKREKLLRLRRLDYGKAEKNFGYFFRAAWGIVEPNTDLLQNWHQDAIAEYLTATLTGDIRRLIINLPPRNAKSLEVSVAFPCWAWTVQPHLRFLCASYSQSLSTKHNVDRRNLIQSSWYQGGWNDRFSLSDDQNQKTEFSNIHRGHMIATSMLGSATGKGGDYVIIDDPHNPKIAESEAQREATIQAFDQSFTTRLDNKKTGRIIVVMQRLHEKDLTGHLLAQGGYEHLCLPAEAPTKTIVHFPISKREVVREKGDILHPEREGRAELDTAKRALGSYGYAGQYEQNPTPRTGGILKRTYWRYYRQLPVRFDEMLQSWDMAFKDLESSDYVVGLVLGRVGANIYLVDMARDQMGLTDTCRAVTNLSSKWPDTYRKLIEDKANGPAVIDVLKSKIPGLVAVEPDGSKIARAYAVEPTCEAGNVYFPMPEVAPWIETVIHELASFPKGAHDDIVDAFTQGIRRLVKNATSSLQVLSQL